MLNFKKLSTCFLPKQAAGSSEQSKLFKEYGVGKHNKLFFSVVGSKRCIVNVAATAVKENKDHLKT